MSKKKKEKKFYDYVRYWNTCMENGRSLTGAFGLCGEVARGNLSSKLLSLFEPTENDEKWLKWEKKSTLYWGSDSTEYKLGEFTPLRQTIVLFMAAMKKQL